MKSLLCRLLCAGVPHTAPRILRTLPHDREAFTQGLAYCAGLLYESTGTLSRSSLRCIDPADGNVRRIVPVVDDFAEGIAVLGTQLYQLSWKSEKARVYRLPELRLAAEIPYQGEGWGLASNGRALVMSNGTSRLRFLDAGLRTTRECKVLLNRIPVKKINDLEWVNGSIYANVWHSSSILELSAAKGTVTRIIDCSSLVAMAAPAHEEAVLNGIAYNAESDTFFLAGKNWDLMFEVAIPARVR